MSGEATKELGWNPTYDEGIRLITTHANFSGLRARLQLPAQYTCPSPKGYFNFYLGINFREAGAVEAGISCSNEFGWRYFVNPPGRQIAPAVVTPGSVIALELDVRDHQAQLSIGAFDGVGFFGSVVARGTAGGSAGSVKMVAAMQEFHANSNDRKIWFDKIVFSALQLRKEGRTDWLDIPKIQGLQWLLERPPSSHHLIDCASASYENFEPCMARHVGGPLASELVARSF